MFYIFILIGVMFFLLWTSQLLFVKLHLLWSNKLLSTSKEDIDCPVTIIHPVKDLDYEYEKNVESWINQEYSGDIQHIFSFQDGKDPAIEVIKKMIDKYPQKDVEIIVNPVMDGLNGKSSNMVNGIKKAKYEMLLFGDSDTRVKSDFVVKMIRPLKDRKVGVTTCGQINIGGSNFWTRFFTFVQNSETDFIWAFFTKLGLDLGMTGAAFGMRKQLIIEVGGLESYGNSLLEDLHLGNKLFKMGYKIVLGPFVECHVGKLKKEKSINYAKRIATGVKAHIAIELPAFVIMLFWYWGLFIWAMLAADERLIYLSFSYICLRVIYGLMQRVVTLNKIKPIDFTIPLIFDLFGTFFLVCAFKNQNVTWRGVRYEVKKGGFIEGVDIAADIAEEE